MLAFSSSETAVLDRKADVRGSIHATAARNIDLYYELDRCAEWAKKNGLCKVLSVFYDVYFRNEMKILNHIKDEFHLVFKNLYPF
jgi:hypothetical protein